MAKVPAKKPTAKASTAVVKNEPKEQQLQQLERNYFVEYGQAQSLTNIVGTLVMFNKGDWLSGKDKDPVEEGTQFVAEMETLEIGWIKWENEKPAQQIMGKVSEGYIPPKRNTLGDLDEGEWDVDESSGKPRDPWQFSNHIILRPVGMTEAVDDSDKFTFASSSRGGLNMIGEVCKIYGREMRQRPDEWPVVELGSSAYNHPNKQFGRIKVPVMTVVGWEPKNPEDNEAAPAPKKAAKPAAKGRPAAPVKAKRKAA